jgi:hypothetical protein
LSGKTFEPTLLALIKDIEPVFPEMERRIIAVSEMEVQRDNIPTFPIAMFALQDINFAHDAKSNKSPDLVETFVGEFWFRSNKILNSKSKETPFWAYYDYDPLLQKFVDFILQWESPRGYPVQLVKMDLESSDLAVMLSFTLRHTYTFCKLEQQPEGIVKTVENIRIKTECVDCNEGAL